MKFKFAVTAILATIFFVTPGWAWHKSDSQQATVPDTKTTKPSKYNIKLNVAGGYGGSGTATSVGCIDGDNFAAVCYSGDCTCYTYTGTVSGAAGNGTMTMYESYDNIYGYGGIAGDSGCDLAFGEIDITGTKDDEVISFQGSDCGSVFTDQYFLAGGCTLEDTDVFGEGAVGACSGNFNYTNGKNTTFSISGTSLK